VLKLTLDKVNTGPENKPKAKNLKFGQKKKRKIEY